MSDTRPIGVYDSGVGGLTVVSEIETQLPHERIIYFADNGRSPYGEKTPEDILKYSQEIIEFLLHRGVKMIIAACNTSSALALPHLQGKYGVPLIGLIAPGVRAAIRATTARVVGLWATRATVNSGAYAAEMARQRPDVKMISVACPRLVPIVEGEFVSEPELRMILQEYMRPIVAGGADTLILGCTHYPFLAQPIRSIAPGICLVDPAAETVRVAASVLRELRLTNAADDITASRTTIGTLSGAERGKGTALPWERHEYYVSGDPEQFRTRAKLLTGKDLSVRTWER